MKDRTFFENLVEALISLGAFNPVRRLARAEGIAARSWDELRGKLQTHWSESLASNLVELYVDLSLHGRKVVHLYRLSTRDRGALLERFPNTASNAGSQSLILQHQGDRPRLARITDTPSARVLIFTSVRKVKSEERIDPRLLKLPEGLRIPDEVRFINYKDEPATDVVVISKTLSMMEIRIHQSQENKMYPSAEEVRSDLLNEIYSSDWSFGRGAAIDVFPAVSSIYDTPSEGRVTKLCFICSSSAKRRETLQLKDSEVDLRTEEYHKAGMAKIKRSSIEIFGLAVHWPKDEDGNDLHDARLEFPGSLRNLERKEPLYAISFPYMMGAVEYNFMMGRVRQHVRR